MGLYIIKATTRKNEGRGNLLIKFCCPGKLYYIFLAPVIMGTLCISLACSYQLLQNCHKQTLHTLQFAKFLARSDLQLVLTKIEWFRKVASKSYSNHEKQQSIIYSQPQKKCRIQHSPPTAALTNEVVMMVCGVALVSSRHSYSRSRRVVNFTDYPSL